MSSEYLIAIDEFYNSHNIEISFVSSLQQIGLVEITTIEDTGFIDTDQLQQLEKYLRLHYELDINFEEIDTIKHLLLCINALYDEIKALQNRLRLHENDFKTK